MVIVLSLEDNRRIGPGFCADGKTLDGWTLDVPPGAGP
jgi:hypothetical protein